MSNDNALDAGLLAFQEESCELLALAEATLLKLEEYPNDADLIGELFRSVHTIKGASGVFGFDEVVSFTHVAESVMGLLREQKISLNKALISSLLDARDHMEQLIDAAMNGNTLSAESVATGKRILADLETYLIEKSPSKGEKAAHTAEAHIEGEPSQNDNWHISLRFPEDTLMNGMEPISLLRYLKKFGDIVKLELVDSRLPAYKTFDPERFYLGIELELASDSTREEIHGAFEFFSEGCTVSILPPHSALKKYRKLLNDLPEQEYFLGELLVKMGALTDSELAQILDKQNELRDTQLTPPRLGQLAVDEGALDQSVLNMALEKQDQSKKKQLQKNQTIRINPQKLGYLIDLVGELVISSAHINVQVKQHGHDNLTESAENMGWLVNEIRSVSLGLRMVQIGETFDRYRRVVRDLSKEFSKDIEFCIEGGDTELDKTVVEKISDPLMHMVRNAIDHGIETPEERIAAGKGPTATLKLRAYHESGNVSIEISDDGRGINKEKILAKATENGLLKNDRKRTDRDIYQLIFEPGFSTADKVSSVSGRGVGMDVVKRNVEELRGTIDVNSRPGKGAIFTIRLPLTLAIIDGFQVNVNGCSYIIPLGIIDECIELNKKLYDTEKGGKYICLRGEVLPYVRLNDIFGSISPNTGFSDKSDVSDAINAGRENIVVVQCGGKKFGLVVNELLGEQQAVIKPLGKIFQNLSCISGATILGGGDVAMILDVPQLLALA